MVQQVPPLVETGAFEHLWVETRGFSAGTPRFRTFLLRFLLVHGLTRAWVYSWSELWESVPG